MHPIADVTRLLLRSLLFVALATTATAQIPGPNQPQLPEPGLPGQWDIYDGEGNPIRPDLDAGVDITINPDGSYHGDVWICKDQVTTYIPDEAMTIWRVGYGDYVWENNRGHHGIISWDPYYGVYRSLVISGPNTGTERTLVD